MMFCRECGERNKSQADVNCEKCEGDMNAMPVLGCDICGIELYFPDSEQAGRCSQCLRVRPLTKPTAATEVGNASYPDKIKLHCDAIKELLLKKNAGYSKGAGFTPSRKFSKVDTVERILTRLDDKDSRWNAEGPTRENVDDTIGYLILLRIEREAEGWKQRG